MVMLRNRLSAIMSDQARKAAAAIGSNSHGISRASRLTPLPIRNSTPASPHNAVPSAIRPATARSTGTTARAITETAGGRCGALIQMSNCGKHKMPIAMEAASVSLRAPRRQTNRRTAQGSKSSAASPYRSADPLRKGGAGKLAVRTHSEPQSRDRTTKPTVGLRHIRRGIRRKGCALGVALSPCIVISGLATAALAPAARATARTATTTPTTTTATPASITGCPSVGGDSCWGGLIISTVEVGLVLLVQPFV
jgi:hypothetical protein